MSEVWLREPRDDECDQISALCVRSKAYWGYDAAFMEACTEELAVTPQDLAANFTRVAKREGTIIGFVEVTRDGDTCDLEKLFIEPGAMGGGVGRLLFEAATQFARQSGAQAMTIAADPGAAPFYEKMGARCIGEIPSGSIAGRMLPLLRLETASG